MWFESHSRNHFYKIENMKNFKYDLEAVIQPLDSMNDEIWKVNFRVVWNDETHLEGCVDWQSGITIWQTEGIEYDDFILIMKVASMAIEDCKTLIGKKRWELGGNKY